jgi:hypothetical protein
MRIELAFNPGEVVGTKLKYGFDGIKNGVYRQQYTIIATVSKPIRRQLYWYINNPDA